MAIRLLQAYSSVIKPASQSLLSSTRSLLPGSDVLRSIKHSDAQSLVHLKTVFPITFSVRSTSFFAKNSAETLWKSVTSVSNAGKHRGRGKGTRRLMRNLNEGQQIGVGKINMMWPGLTGPIMQGRMVMKQRKLPDDPEREAKLIKLRDAKNNRTSRRVHPLERGWTSARIGGRSIGPPDPVNEETFDGFDTKVLEHKIVAHMTGNLGKKRTYSTFVVTGNKNGLCGIAVGKAPEGRAALRLAKNRAGSKLMYIPLYNNHTVYHDFFAQFGASKVFVTKKPEGYGLVCHRVIKCACEVIGIKDLHVKVEGAAKNYQHIIKAFLIGLLKQKTHQELAEEKKLHLVEFRKENLMYPKVVASPSTVRKPREVKSTEVLDFTQYVLDGKVVLKKRKYPPFYTKLKSYEIHKRKMEYLRNQDDVRLRLYAEYGELRSFLTDEFPEARPQKWWLKKDNEDQVEQ